MAVEIERKFLVKNEQWRESVIAETRLRQGYLTTGEGGTVRVRIDGERAYLTIKGATVGIRRFEFEYEIPLPDAELLLEQVALKPQVEKIRYQVRCGKHVWDLDRFLGENQGLVLAEIELEAENEAFELPGWAGEEVSDDPRYHNSNLVTHPFREW
jgi:adenylate cyclase